MLEALTILGLAFATFFSVTIAETVDLEHYCFGFIVLGHFNTSQRSSIIKEHSLSRNAELHELRRGQLSIERLPVATALDCAEPLRDDLQFLNAIATLAAGYV